jgi:hypothetical protein
MSAKLELLLDVLPEDHKPTEPSYAEKCVTQVAHLKSYLEDLFRANHELRAELNDELGDKTVVEVAIMVMDRFTPREREVEVGIARGFADPLNVSHHYEVTLEATTNRVAAMGLFRRFHPEASLREARDFVNNLPQPMYRSAEIPGAGGGTPEDVTAASDMMDHLTMTWEVVRIVTRNGEPPQRSLLSRYWPRTD